MRVLDLFSGIGGFSLGLERTGGFRTVAFCESDPHCQKVLKKHWPRVPIYNDIRHLDASVLASDGITADVITGGFPCQDISYAGKGKGLNGTRSGLWHEMLRIIRDVRPTWAIVENVSALRSRGLARILQDLCKVGYCVEWHCIPASSIGAPHQRDRIWITAYGNPDSHSQSAISLNDEAPIMPGTIANPDSQRGCMRHPEWQHAEDAGQPPISEGYHTRTMVCWDTESSIRRVAHGVPRRVDRLRQLGNSVVPQIPQLIGEAIIRYEEAHP